MSAATARHHLPQELLLSYASGAGCGDGEALLIASHLTLCPACRDQLAELEALGACFFQSLPQSQLSPGLLDATAERMQEFAACKTSKPALSDSVLPRPLLELTGPLANIEWQSRFFGLLRYVELPIETQGIPVRLQCIRRSADIPRHQHSGVELELYLAGGALDTGNGKRYARGDVSVYESHEPHELKVDPDEDCILLAVHSAPLVPTNLLGRAIYGLLGWT